MVRHFLKPQIVVPFVLGFISHSTFWSFIQLLQDTKPPGSGVTTTTTEQQQLQVMDHSFWEKGNNVSIVQHNDVHLSEISKEEEDSTIAIQDDSIASSISDPSSTNNDNDNNNVCSAFNLDSTSPSKIWSKHLNKIIHATRHPTDPEEEFTYHDFTAQLLNYMTPQRLQTSIKTLPSRYWDRVEQVMRITWERYQFIHNSNNIKNNGVVSALDDEPPRKLNILIMGGSVTMGVVCITNPVKQTRIARRDCAWTGRLNSFLRELFGDVVNVHTTTLGGTNTESAIRIWDYSLFSSDMPHPDIVIHAYSGNEQRQILKTKSFGNAIHTLATYYGFGLISYADAVRHLVYGDTHEDWFSPNMWPERQVHPGMGMHISSVWVIAFNMLNMASTYCDGLFMDRESKTGAEDSFKYVPANGLPPLRDNNKLAGEPQLIPRGLPPELNTNTSLDTISSVWQSTQKEYFDSSKCNTTDHSKPKPCVFSWVGGLERYMDKPQALEQRMNTVIIKNDGWEASKDNEKLGFQSTKPNAFFEMKLSLDNIDVQTLNFMVMTSYGEKWEASKIKVDAFVDRSGNVDPAEKPTKSMEILGFHDRQTSETYNYKLDLGEEKAVPNDTLRVLATLMGGTTFKFMGMALCDR